MQLSIDLDEPRIAAPRARLALISGGQPDGNVYVFYIAQRSGPDMWKIGHTVRWPERRARELAATPVCWWSGSVADERRCHRRFKHRRLSPGCEYFYRGADIDQWVFEQATRWATRDQLATLADIFRMRPGEIAA